MYKSEALLFDQLKFLKNVYNIQGIKAEFEAEGSSYRDVNRLQRLCGKLGVPVHLKIGGVEAVRDIKDATELGVSGLIAPMVESEFAAKKFLDATHTGFLNNPEGRSEGTYTKHVSLDDKLMDFIGI